MLSARCKLCRRTKDCLSCLPQIVTRNCRSTYSEFLWLKWLIWHQLNHLNLNFTNFPGRFLGLGPPAPNYSLSLIRMRHAEAVSRCLCSKSVTLSFDHVYPFYWIVIAVLILSPVSRCFSCSRWLCQCSELAMKVLTISCSIVFETFTVLDQVTGVAYKQRSCCDMSHQVTGSVLQGPAHFYTSTWHLYTSARVHPRLNTQLTPHTLLKVNFVDLCILFQLTTVSSQTHYKVVCKVV